VFTARYALSPYIKQIRFVFKGLNITQLTISSHAAIKHSAFTFLAAQEQLIHEDEVVCTFDECDKLWYDFSGEVSRYVLTGNVKKETGERRTLLTTRMPRGSEKLPLVYGEI
jgi:hypothetical protein